MKRVYAKKIAVFFVLFQIACGSVFASQGRFEERDYFTPHPKPVLFKIFSYLSEYQLSKLTYIKNRKLKQRIREYLGTFLSENGKWTLKLKNTFEWKEYMGSHFYFEEFSKQLGIFFPFKNSLAIQILYKGRVGKMLFPHLQKQIVNLPFFKMTSEEKRKKFYKWIYRYCTTYTNYFDCRKLNLQYLHPEISKLQGIIRKLDFEDCNIRYLPAEFSKLKKLQYLYLSKNRLENFPGDITYHNLIVLDLSHNKLTYLPASIGRLNKLESLLINNNRLRELPETMKHLTNLTGFNVCHNRLSKLPENKRFLRKLKVLDISDNDFVSIDFSDSKKNFCRITNLNLSGNKLSELPKTISKFTSLRYINLSFNDFTHFPSCLSSLKNLREIVMRSNKIIVAPRNLKFKKLQELDLTYNPFAHPRGVVLEKGIQFIMENKMFIIFFYYFIFFIGLAV